MSYEQQTYRGGVAPVGEDPNKTLGIVGLVLAFVAPIIGVIVSYIAKKKSAEGGYPENTPAKWGFILGLIFTILGVVFAIIYFIAIAAIIGSSGM